MTSTARHPAAHPLPLIDPKRPDRPLAVCPYCGVGCVLRGHVADNAVTRITADPGALPNRGMMCPKGATLGKVFGHGKRLLFPMLRTSRDQPLRRATWDEAIRFIAERIDRVARTHGPDALAWYGSGQLDTEASYVFTKLFKGFLRCNHTDTNSRLCMSSAASGYAASFGSDGPPTCYDDIEHADTFLLLGANMAANHPVLFNMVRKRRATADHARIIAVDPRRTRTAEHADLHVPVKPGGDAALLQLVARRLLDRRAIDTDFVEARTANARAYLDHLRALDTTALHELSGVDADTIRVMTDMIVGRRLLSFYCMGLNQSAHGTLNNTAVINLHLLLGAVGKIGCGPFSLTGQPNAMGGREVGYMSHQLPGYRFVSNAAHRAQVEAAWNLPPGAIDPEPGRHAVDLFAAAAEGRVHVMWIACTNPAVTLPDAGVAQAGLRRTSLVIVQDITPDSETAAFADVLLPAAQWGEKTGTMTNSERLVSRSFRFLDPPGEAMPDWWPPAAVARALGFEGFDFAGASDVWDEFRALTVGRLCDLSGMTNERLSRESLRWPCPDEGHPGGDRLYADRRFAMPDGKARFDLASATGPDETPDDRYPLTLTTGRVAAHWHTRTKTGLVPELNAQEPHPFIEMHPDDARPLGIAEGDRVRLTSRRGVAEASVRLTRAIRPGVLFMPFHWGEAYDALSNVNRLTNPAYDPASKQPELKACAVRASLAGTVGGACS